MPKPFKTIFEKKNKPNSLILRWGLVCRAGSQVPVLGLKIKKLLLSHFATLLIFLSLSALLFLWGPLLFFEARYKVTSTIKKQESKKTSYFNVLIERQLKRQINIAPDAYFSLVIPKIGAKSRIISNVDPSRPDIYEQALKEGVAHAAGTFFPGMEGNITLFAHSTDAPYNITRFNAVFYLLRELESGDLVYIYFKGVRRTYRVTSQEITAANDTDPFKKQEGEEVLIMQTCYPPGTSLQRLLVYAKPV